MKYLMVGVPEYQNSKGRYALRTDDLEDNSTLVALIRIFKPEMIKRIA